MMRTCIPVVAAMLLTACVAVPPVTAPPPAPGAPPRPEAPSLGFFSRIKVPGGNEPALKLAAKGVQIFRCERVGNSLEWRFRLPEAELFDERGESVGRHGALFSFEHRDGSRLLGTVVAHENADSAEALPWLLFSAKSFGQGEFGGVTFVQRINTRGGMPPQRCGTAQLNQLLRVDFSADFVFYRGQG